MQFLSALFVASVLFVNSVSAQSSLAPSLASAASVTGADSTPTPLGPIFPDLSVLSGSMMTVSTAAASSDEPDISVVGEWTTPADDAYVELRLGVYTGFYWANPIAAMPPRRSAMSPPLLAASRKPSAPGAPFYI